MRKKLVVGNWKMFTTRDSAVKLARDVAAHIVPDPHVAVILCPPFPYLSAVRDAIEGTPVLLGAQNCYHEVEGAFTGEVSPKMLLDVGCKYVILGHSERRRVIGEPSQLINRKVHRALEAGLKVIVCAGETKEERDAGKAEAIVEEQLRESLKGCDHDRLPDLVMAYEPVWAIGTGVNASPQQAQDMHHTLRQKFAAVFGETKAGEVPLLYGGSVKPDNAADLMGQGDVDGVLVGGASLKADQFLAIYQAALGG